MNKPEEYFTSLIPQTAFRKDNEKGIKSFSQKYAIDLTLTNLHISDENIKKELRSKILMADDYIASILLPEKCRLDTARKTERLKWLERQLGL